MGLISLIGIDILEFCELVHTESCFDPITEDFWYVNCPQSGNSCSNINICRLELRPDPADEQGR